MIVLAMVGLVLIQKSEGGGLGMGGGGGGFMSSRGTANVLTRATAILAALFFATSLILSIIAGIDRKPRSILDSNGAPAAPGAPGADDNLAAVYDDARNKVEKDAAFKDVKKQVVPIAQTQEIPNDTISVRAYWERLDDETHDLARAE